MLAPFTRRILLPAALAGTFLASSGRAAEPVRKIGVQGHRGARAMRPENTLPAFEYAISIGADALELDMAVTKDNVLVISHDPILRPPVCTGPAPFAVIHQLTLAQVREWDCGAKQNPEFPTQQTVPGTRMPTLDEVFQLAPKGTFRFNIETKIFPNRTTQAAAEGMAKRMGLSPGTEQGRAAVAALMSVGPDVTPSPEDFVKLVLETIRKYHLEDRVILQSFDYRTLRAMKKLAPEVLLSALTSDRDRSFVEIAKEAGAQIVSPVYPTVTAAKVRAAHDAGLQVIPWTPNKPEEWDKVIAAQPDAIITDDPAGLIAYLKTSHLRK
jgi:glycerophosphoryl diester phosphodiesterase